jgi:hypothetical protein
MSWYNTTFGGGNMDIDIVKIITDNLFSIIIVVFGAMFLYFGKIIQDIQVNEGDKFDIYYNGLMFSSVYVIIPLALAFYIVFTYITTYDEVWADILVFVQIAILLPTLYYIVEYTKKRDKGVSVKKSRYEMKQKYAFPTLLISFFSWLFTLYCYGSFRQTQTSLNFVYFLLSLVLLIFTLSVLAGIFSYNTVYYPKVIIHMASTTAPFTEVRLVKFAKTVRISKAEKPILINKENIDHIEILD